MGEFAIGQSVSRFEDPRLLKGGGRYVGDMALPGMAFGHVLRSPHAHARIRSIDTIKAKAAPGVLAVLTGADWQASGWGDLPVPGGLKLRNGGVFKPPYPALAKDKVRWVGDYVAFVVAETTHQALDAAELIEIDYEPLPAIASTAEATAKGAPRVWDDCAENIGFVQLFGDKAATDAAFAKADHVVKHRFVINRVTAATMEPRGCIGDYNPPTAATPLHHPAAGASLPRRPGADPQGAGEQDPGGGRRHRRQLRDEVGGLQRGGAGAAGLEAARPAGEVDLDPLRSFLCDAQARDNVTDAELALDKEGNFLGMRVTTLASIGAFLQTGMQAFTGNIGTLAGVYRTPAIHADVTAVFTHTNPVRPYRGNGRPEAAYVIERLVDLAADELGIDPAELRRRNYISPAAMPFKTGLTFTYDNGEFEKSMDMALKLADVAGFEKRRGEARKRGKLRGLGMSNTIERAAAQGFEGAEIRFDKSGAVTLFSGSVTQGQGTRPFTSRSPATGSGSIPRRSTTSRATPIRCSWARALGARARRRSAARRSTPPPTRSPPRARRSPPTRSRSMPPRSISPMASSPARRPTARSPSRRSPRSRSPRQAAEGHGGRADRRHLRRRCRTSPTAATSASSTSTRTPARSRSCATA